MVFDQAGEQPPLETVTVPAPDATVAIDFQDSVVAAQRWEALRIEMGMTPEMSEVLTLFRGVVGKVLDEIAEADLNAFAERISRHADSSERSSLGTRKALTPRTQDAVEAEGVAGLKRSWLEAKARSLEREFSLLMNALIDVRVDLITSQQE